MQFIDARATLPRHASKTFKTRNVGKIVGGVVHQTAGGDDPVQTAAYHVGPNHISETGTPGLLYTFFIPGDGVVWWAHDLEARTWSQGGHGTPVPGTSANGSFLAICLGGSFDGPGYKGRTTPTFAQLHSLLCLWAHLTGTECHPDLPEQLWGALSCPVEALYGHHLFGKPACPGEVVAALVDSVRAHLPPAGAALPSTIVTASDWQAALAALGHYTGEVDGLWGSKSRAALVSFQRSRTNLTNDGVRGLMSAAELQKAVAAL